MAQQHYTSYNTNNNNENKLRKRNKIKKIFNITHSSHKLNNNSSLTNSFAHNHNFSQNQPFSIIIHPSHVMLSKNKKQTKCNSAAAPPGFENHNIIKQRKSNTILNFKHKISNINNIKITNNNNNNKRKYQSPPPPGFGFGFDNRRKNHMQRAPPPGFANRYIQQNKEEKSEYKSSNSPSLTPSITSNNSSPSIKSVTTSITTVNTVNTITPPATPSYSGKSNNTNLITPNKSPNQIKNKNNNKNKTKTNFKNNIRSQILCTKQIKLNDNESVITDNDDSSDENELNNTELPNICIVRVFRLIINSIINKNIFESLLQKICDCNSIRKIFIRSHKSWFHPHSTVIYIHFINFDPDKYQKIIGKYLNFRNKYSFYDYTGNNSKYGFNQNRLKPKRYKGKHQNILTLLGNKLNTISHISSRQYPIFKINKIYLHCVINICLRCKTNKAIDRKRICTYCLELQRNDRLIIGGYYKDLTNNVKYKDENEIMNDLLHLKIELNVIPLMYSTECRFIDHNTNKCASINPSKCTYWHNKHEKLFGNKLSNIKYNAMQKERDNNNNPILSNSNNNKNDFVDYFMIKRKIKYRNIIGEYYESKWRNIIIDNHDYNKKYRNINVIKQYLIENNVKLHLIPLTYQQRCYNQSYCKRKICTFIHNENEKQFGALLQIIKDNAITEEYNKIKQQNEEKQKIEQTTDTDNDLIDDNKEDTNNLNNINNDKYDDKWWTNTIQPYLNANDEEYIAADKEVKSWSINNGIIDISTTYLKHDIYSNFNKEEHGLYVEYCLDEQSNEKNARIGVNKTCVTFTIKCQYKYNYFLRNVQQELYKILNQCQYIKQYKIPIIRKKDKKNPKKKNIILSQLIAEYAVTINDTNYSNCIGCYFKMCDGIRHKIINNNQLNIECLCGKQHNANDEHGDDFNVKYCDQLKGVVINKTKQKHSLYPKITVLIMKKWTLNDTYLKFLTIGSNKFNKNNFAISNTFNNVYISYSCNTSQFDRIRKQLQILYNPINDLKPTTTKDKMNMTDIQYRKLHMHLRLHPINSVLFEYNNMLPIKMNDYSFINKDLISSECNELNKSQINAIYNGLHYNIHTIQGPPGTGKTNTCAHLSYLWWKFNSKFNKNNYPFKMKIHGIAPTNQGTRVLATKCIEIYNKYSNNNDNDHKAFKVLFLASSTYEKILINKVQQHEISKKKHNNHNKNDKLLIEDLCVNLVAIKEVQRLESEDEAKYKSNDKAELFKKWSDIKRENEKKRIIGECMKSADMICTTFGNSMHPLMMHTVFTHIICDECNQSSLDTFVGIILPLKKAPRLKYISMAGDIKQLKPVAASDNILMTTSVYERLVKYLTKDKFVENQYYTKLDTQYRSHSQIYGITTSIFYDNKVKNAPNNNIKHNWNNKNNTVDYSKLFVNNNHIQWHILTNREKQIDGNVHSKYSIHEANIALKYLLKYKSLGGSEKDIAIISDYSAQINCMEDVIFKISKKSKINRNKLLLGTTNEIEGESRKIIIYMFCRSNNTGNIGFLNDTSRVNVGTSRAEKGQIIIGDIFTLHYNSIYRKIFNYHQKYNSVVYGENINKLTFIKCSIPLILRPKNNGYNNNSIDYDIKRRRRCDYVLCNGCNQIYSLKSFIGRIISLGGLYRIYFCFKCINKYATRLIKAKELVNQHNSIYPYTIFREKEFNISDSFTVELEFDMILGNYLVKNNLTTFTKHEQISFLYLKFLDIIKQMYDELSTNKYFLDIIPIPFQKLYNDYLKYLDAKKNKKSNNISSLQITDDFIKNLRSNELRSIAIGIMECKRNHLLEQTTIDSRFYRVVNKFKKSLYELNSIKIYYNKNPKNRYIFYKYKEYEQLQPTLVVKAYLRACGFSMKLVNNIYYKVCKILTKKNQNNKNRYNPILLNDNDINIIIKIYKLNELKSIYNVLSIIKNEKLSNRYIIKLMENAIINDSFSEFSKNQKKVIALKKEHNFGDLLIKNGFPYYSENELIKLGYNETPDYLLKKPWIIMYNDKRYEIIWIDFKWFYCSSNECKLNKLQIQAKKFNSRFGPGAFVFSLGYVKLPKKLQLISNDFIAALPLSKNTFIKYFTQLQNQNKKNIKNVKSNKNKNNKNSKNK